MGSRYNLLLPMKLDAFVFNGSVCDGVGADKAKIAPVTQPNYTFLQLKDHLVQNDILDHVDLHASAPKNKNSRYVDVGKAPNGEPTVRQNRVGAYVHWSLPRPLRSGMTKPDKETTNIGGAGSDKDQGSDARAPSYPAIPNRWRVIRSFDPGASTTVPRNPPGIRPVTAWVIESDKTRSIDDLPASTDLEVDVAPFVTSFLRADQKPGDMSVEEQAEVFIGSCIEASDWDASDTPEEGELRVSLTAASSSNQLFIDYQYHCGNVFSMLDTFAYEDGSTTKHLDSVVADYYVVGWHNDPEEDVMADLKGSREQQPRSARLEMMRIGINKTVPAGEKTAIEDWLSKPDASRTLCHGSMYDVIWKIDELPPKRPADALAKNMQKWPLAVGTTPMDAVLTYIGNRDRTGDVEKQIWALQALLRAAEDGVDAQIAAADEAQAYNYAHLDGGDHFYLPAEDGKQAGADPPADLQLSLRQGNSAQVLLDATRRRLKQLRWDMFSWWWKLISDVDNDEGTRATGQRTIHDVQDEINSLVDMMGPLQVFIDGVVAAIDKGIKKGVMEAFHQRSDPTLIIGGVEAGWPKDFNRELEARIDSQTIDLTGPPTGDAYTKSMPPDLKAAGDRLVEEFFSLKDATAKKDDRIIPLYHDKDQQGDDPAETDPWRDRWNESQSWFPLYVEWEAEYAHIPFQHWHLTQRPPRKDTTGKTTYTLKDDIRMKDPSQQYNDLRYVSGRSLILPQPAFSLRVHIERLFATLSPAHLDSLMTKTDRESLLKKLERLALLSLPLSGLTDHLTTRFQGSHVKPLVRPPGGNPVVLKEATDVLPPPLHGRTPIDLSLIGEHSDPTPYGSLATLANPHVSGFKPVTHGQMRFTKINVVDKFGQAVHAIEPTVGQTKPVYPSIGEFYDVDKVPGDEGMPNVVYDNRSTLDQPEYVQLPPSINQPARFNASFVVRDVDPDGATWRPATEFDRPIWGWVVVNYVDRGLQFFLPGGDFYREVRSTDSDIKWVPFAEQAVPKNNEQLDALISSLTAEDKRLRAFMDMIMSALSATVPAPTAYSQFLNSLVGRPLALANMGWSLELEANSLKNESTVPEQHEFPLDFGLLRGDGVGQYEFPVKFGDEMNNYDGLVGYFRVKGLESPKVRSDGGDLDLSQIYTYFHAKYELDGAPLAPIDTASYPRLKSFWVDPHRYQPKTRDEVQAKAREYEAARNGALQIFGAIFDPFAPITAFSSILPMRKLQLPSWTWETDLKRITTFFHAGPLLLTDKLPAFDGSKRLDPKKYDVADTPENAQVCLPALKAADWAWLQPYDLKSNSEARAYMPIDVAGDSDEAPKWQKGPLTAIEGFMQLKAPLEQGKAKQG
ncbi:hypothetical protein ACHAQH_008727 [Verticillium albo-atrum]